MYEHPYLADEVKNSGFAPHIVLKMEKKQCPLQITQK
jgi:hypothetical protein